MPSIWATGFNSPIGWAAVAGNGRITTTGGGNGNIVVARNAAELTSFARSSSPLTIVVEGAITGTGTLNVASNKTIIGSGSNASITGIELGLSGVSNVIIRNLTLSGARDAIALRRSHHVWIDRVDVSNGTDGAIDITNESDFVTVSWSKFSNHDKTMLINSGTSQPADIGKLNTTLHHNWWNGSNQRNPRVGYGKVHVFNNLYDGTNMDYGVGIHSGAKVLVENNYFDRTPNPIQQMYVSDPTSEHYGFAESIGNVFNRTTGRHDANGVSFDVEDYYSYDFALNPASQVPSVVMAGVGPRADFGILGPLPIPGNGAVGLGEDTVLAWTRGMQSATEYIVSFGTGNSFLETHTTSDLLFDPTFLAPSTDYFWRVDQVTGSGVIQGETWRFRTAAFVSAVPEPDSLALLLPSLFYWLTRRKSKVD